MAQVFAGRYELLSPIAQGGMGSVWRVRDLRDDTIRAAKLLGQRDAGSLLRFMREQSTRIHHPHVVTPLSWAGEDDQVLFTMPLLRGGSVATLINDYGPLPEPWVRVVLDQTLAGLDAIHAAGVVHRDIKPANLLLEPTGPGVPHVRVTDFGIAVPLDEPRLTAPSTALGTRGYMSPEQSQGADPDPRQDLYAVAVTGLEMLTAIRPPVPDDAVPSTRLGALLRRVAEADPAQRPDDAAGFRELLAEAAPERGWEPGEIEVFDHFGPDRTSAQPLEPAPRTDDLAATRASTRRTPDATAPDATARAAGDETAAATAPLTQAAAPGPADAAHGSGQAAGPSSAWPIVALLVVGLLLLGVGGLILM